MAQVLKVDSKQIELYRTLPIHGDEKLIKSTKDHVKVLNLKVLGKIGRSSHIKLDTPAQGPLSNLRPEIIPMLVAHILYNDGSASLYSNEFRVGTEIPGNTVKFLAVLFLALCYENKGGAPAKATLPEKADEIFTTCRAAFNDVNRQNNTLKAVDLKLFELFKSKFSLFLPSKEMNSVDRYNPLTIIVIEPNDVKMAMAYAYNEVNSPWSIKDVAGVNRTFDNRHPSFTKIDITKPGILDMLLRFGITLRFV